jgi:cytochrome c-type biogenesis protein CcmH/NrfG
MNPQSAEGLNSLGGALSRQGKKEEALGAYAQATRLKPSLDLLPEIHFNWGNTLVALGRVEEAKLKEQSIEFHQR